MGHSRNFKQKLFQGHMDHPVLSLVCQSVRVDFMPSSRPQWMAEIFICTYIETLLPSNESSSIYSALRARPGSEHSGTTSALSADCAADAAVRRRRRVLRQGYHCPPLPSSLEQSTADSEPQRSRLAARYHFCCVASFISLSPSRLFPPRCFFFPFPSCPLVASQ